ncbi:ABC transporter, partial [Glutamicibacter creatinolyticus]
PLRRLTRRQLSRAQIIEGTYDPNLPSVGWQATLNDALDTMLVSSTESAIVTGLRDAYAGIITVQTVMEAISAANAAAGADHEAPVGLNSGAISQVALQDGEDQ